MKLSVWGLGYVGTVSAGCLAQEGHEVIGVDSEPTKVDLINAGKSPIIEKDIGRIIEQQVAAGRLSATVDALERLHDYEDLERSERCLMIDLGELRVAGPEGSAIGFREIQDFLASSLKTAHVRRLVIDSLSAIGLHYASPGEFRERLFGFSRFLRDQEVTTLLIAESPDAHALTAHGVEQFIADSFVHLGLEEVKGELRRTLTVRKMRFTKHDTTKHPMYITPAGLTVAADEKVV